MEGSGSEDEIEMHENEMNQWIPKYNTHIHHPTVNTSYSADAFVKRAFKRHYCCQTNMAPKLNPSDNHGYALRAQYTMVQAIDRKCTRFPPDDWYSAFPTDLKTLWGIKSSCHFR
jgi:hypothetical protein